MLRCKSMRSMLIVMACLLLPMAPSSAGRIVVNHDEWTLSNTGRVQAGAASFDNFVANLASFMNIDGGSCNYLVYSSNFGLTQSSFQTAMSNSGCTLTNYTGPFNAGIGTLANFDGVFLALSPSTYDPTALANFVDAGGSAYIAAGTGVTGAAAEAAHWNTFLNSYGLGLGAPYNGCCDNDSVSRSHILEAGVSQLFYNNGNTVSLVGANPNAQIIENSVQGLGLIGVFDDISAVPTPAPATLASVALGLLMMAGVMRMRKRGARA